MAETPTYYVTTADDGTKTYHCAYCERQGTEHHSLDEALFLQHMEQRHDGRMVEDAEASATAQRAPEAHPQGGPPGQTGEHPQGGAPGQTGEHPQGGPPGQAEEDVPHPEHPIVLPEEPPKPEEGA